jgi:hypothetical protein
MLRGDETQHLAAFRSRRRGPLPAGFFTTNLLSISEDDYPTAALMRLIE